MSPHLDRGFISWAIQIHLLVTRNGLPQKSWSAAVTRRATLFKMPIKDGCATGPLYCNSVNIHLFRYFPNEVSHQLCTGGLPIVPSSLRSQVRTVCPWYPLDSFAVTIRPHTFPRLKTCIKWELTVPKSSLQVRSNSSTFSQLRKWLMTSLGRKRSCHIAVLCLPIPPGFAPVLIKSRSLTSDFHSACCVTSHHLRRSSTGYSTGCPWLEGTFNTL